MQRGTLTGGRLTNFQRFPGSFRSAAILGLAVTAGLAGPLSVAVPVALAAENAPAAGPPAGIRLAQVGRFRVRPRIQPSEVTEEAAPDSVFLPPDRSLKKRLEEAGELLTKGHYGESVRKLGSLLEGSEDYFFRPDPNQQVYRSLKAEAGRLISEMPAEGRDSYELQFGAQARRMLTDSAAAGDVAGLAEVARRFFYTKAGFEATLLIAEHHLDHERPLAAALCFQRLRDTVGAADRFEPMLSLTLAVCWVRSGMPDKAQQVLVQLKKQSPQGEVRIGDRNVRLFADAKDAIPWLAEKAGAQRVAQRAVAGEWTMFRGDVDRNAGSAGGKPLLNRRWSRLCAEDEPSLEKLVAQLRQAYLDKDIAALPSMQPLAVGDVVLMRTARNLLAVDFVSGKIIWTARSTADRSFEQLVTTRNQPPVGAASPLQLGLDQRMWDDAIFGNVTSDGQQVFIIEDLPLTGNLGMHLGGFPGQGRQVFQANGRRITNAGGLPKTTNRLTARELKTEGKLKWEVGGNSGEDDPKLAGAFFLGPPLPLLGRLYVLAEMKGQDIRLLVLSAKTGQLEWSQQLAVVEENILQDRFRRAAGAMPSFADGVLVCPTAAGAIVAIDLTTRSLLWGYQYPRDRGQHGAMGRFAVLGGGIVNGGSERQGGDRWADGTVTIADGCVLATPVEDDTLYCLHLLDGRVLWKQDRDNSLYVGCVHQGKVLLVGHNQLSAVQLKEGKLAWGPLQLPSGAAPSGRGFYSGKYYYLPLTTAEVAQIDIETGTIVSRTRSRQGTVPGNLICYRGDVISQGVDVVEVYPQLESLQKQVDQTLAKRPDDPTALTQLGEIALDEGRLAEAIRLFRRSYHLKTDDTTRELLVDALTEGLRVDFAANRDSAAELENLLDGEQQQTTYLRLVAAGLQKSGERLAAFDAYLKLAFQEGAVTEPDQLSDVLQVRRDRWIQVQLADLRKNAPPQEKQLMDDAVRKRLDEARDAPPQTLRGLLDVFGSHPAADEVRERLVSRLNGPDTLLEREQLLLRLLASPEPQRARAAVVRLAVLFKDARRPDLASIYYRKLAGPLAGEICADNKTGSQWVAELPAESPVPPLLADPKPWPSGVVEVVKASGGKSLSGTHHQRSFDLELHGSPGPFFNDVNIALDSQQQAVVGEDGLGNERFRISLNEGGNTRRGSAFTAYGGFNNPALNYASVCGNLLLVWMGHHVVAVDALRGKDSAAGRLLWSHELQQQWPGMPNNQGVHHRAVNVPWGPPRYVAAYAFGRPIGTLGTPSDQGICFQRFRDLVCVDPLSGEVYWTRKNLPLGCEIFGDDEVILAAPPEGGEALVLRMLDGELLGKRPVPPQENRMATIGRLLLTWQPEDGKQFVKLTDPWNEKVLWTRGVAFGAKGCLAGQEVLGIFESSGKVGKFSLIRLSDGKALVDSERLDAEPSLTGIHLLSSPDAYLLVTNGIASNVQQNQSIQPAPGGLNNPLISGRLYGFQRETGKRLWGPVKIDQQGLVLSQPSQLPILTFARHVHQSAPNGQPDARTSLLCIDKRSGRIVFSDDKVLNTAISNFEQVGDRADNTVSIMLPGTPAKTITLKLTDKELPAEAQPQQPAARVKRSSGAAQTAAQALGKILEGALQPLKPRKPGENDDD